MIFFAWTLCCARYETKIKEKQPRLSLPECKMTLKENITIGDTFRPYKEIRGPNKQSKFTF